MSYYSVKDVIPETIPEEDENKKSLEPAQYGKLHKLLEKNNIMLS